MQKVLSKLLVAVLTVILVGTNFMPVLTYAASEITQNAKTSQENVEFNASINDSYDTTINVNEEGIFKLNLKVLGTGYLKDATVTLKDNNYQLMEQKSVEIQEGNTIKLNEVKAGEVLDILVPIKVNKQDKVLANEMNRESTVTLNAIYVNEKGKEKKISKELKLNLAWTDKVKENIEQTLVRHIIFGENKTMLSFKIKEGIENNAIPCNAKKIVVQVPSLNNVKPSNVIVIGDNIKYNYENDQVTIEKENTVDAEGKINWNSQDEYTVTYIYESKDTPKSIETKVSAVVTVNGQEVKAETEANTYELKGQLGNFVDVQLSSADELSKGYMYTNLNRQENKLETPYNITYTANIGYRELVDKIIIREQNSLLGEKETSSIKTKKVTIDRENLINILGEDGTIKVRTQDGKEISKFYKGLSEITTEETNLVFETSKPIKEGQLKINIEKVITDNNEYSKKQLLNIKEMTSRAVAETYNGENKISEQQITKTTKLTEPTSEAIIDINQNNLSTVVTNENVIITATLKTSDIKNALYENPKVKISLPEEIKSINLKEAVLIYEDELKPAKFDTNNNEIYIELSGIQTKYAGQSTSEGSVIRIVADLGLDNLATTKQTNLKLTYSNEATNETKEVIKEVGIVAPTEFITTNSIEVDGNRLTAQESDEKVARIPAKAQNKEATISGTIINNLGEEKAGVTILGTIPSQDNKDAEGKSLGSTFNTTLNTAINIEGADADIYYSEDSNETIDGSTWGLEKTNNTKAFKAVLKNNLTDKSSIKFNYKVNVPENVGYEQTSKATYAVYYNNNAKEGNSQNIVMAKAVGMETGEANPIKIESTLINDEAKKVIANGEEVPDGTYLTYKVKVTNSGKDSMKNVKVVTDYPNEVALVTGDKNDYGTNYKLDTETKKFTYKISEIKVGETKEFKERIAIIAKINDDTKKNVAITSVATADNVEEIQSQNQINIIKGDLSSIDFSEDTELYSGEEFIYTLNIKNPNNEEKTNVKAVITIPKEFELIKVYKDQDKYQYDEGKNTITYTIPTLEASENDDVILALKVKEIENDKKVRIQATIQCDGMEEAKQSPSMEYSLISKIAEITHTSNVPSGKLTDKDDLIYYINIKNNIGKTITVNFSDKLPIDLAVVRYTISNDNGEKTIEYTGRTIIEDLSIKPYSSCKITIYTNPYTLESGKKLNVENSPKITVNSKNVNVDKLTHTIVGSSDYTSGDPSNWGDVDDSDSDTTTKAGTYIINGIAWIDLNEDGKRDESEEKLSNITAKLYNKNDGKVALDANDKELIRKTDNNGKYAFTNVLPGDYIVILEYDSNTHAITKYKVQELEESEDSDFIAAKMDGKDVAATNTIAIIDANIYNIDLGLVYKKKFDLRLDKTISRVTVTNTQADIKNKIYDFDDKSIAKVELANKGIDTSTVTVEYSIKVTNEGSIPGYAKKIADYMPNGMTFNSELNTTWYLENNGNVYNTSLANTIINPGETKEIRLVLTRKMSDENLGTIRNTAEIVSSYNEYGLKDVDSTEENKKADEDDMSSADLIIGTATGKTIIAILGITLGILALIATFVYVTKKYIITKII